MLLWSTDQQVTLGFFILPSPFKAQFAVNSHSLYSYFRWSLNGFFTKTCVLATSSNVVFMSAIKCNLNWSNTNIPCFLRTAHDFLFHFTYSFLVLQPLVCNLTVGQQDNCFLGTVLQFRILYGGSWLPSDTPTNRLISLYYLMFSSPQGVSTCNSQGYLMSYHIQRCFFSICHLAQYVAVYLLHLRQILLRNNKFLLKDCWLFQTYWKENQFLFIIATHRFVLTLFLYHVL